MCSSTRVTFRARECRDGLETEREAEKKLRDNSARVEANITEGETRSTGSRRFTDRIGVDAYTVMFVCEWECGWACVGVALCAARRRESKACGGSNEMKRI